MLKRRNGYSSENLSLEKNWPQVSLLDLSTGWDFKIFPMEKGLMSDEKQ